MKLHSNIEVYRSAMELEQNAATRILLMINNAIRERGDCFIALSGGETPRPVYRLLGTPPMKDQVDWSHVHLFFADERIVPPTDIHSNYGMINRELISHIDIPRKNVHRIEVEKKPELVAAEYEQELRKFVSDVVRFDLVLLGIGKDGHTASIFPETAVVEEERAFAFAVFVPLLRSWRVTLTFRSINNAREVLFLVSGKAKAPIVQCVLKLPEPRKEVPATMVQPVNGNLLWMIDGDAAGQTID
jgi:6-phosphogluconolactonase